MEQLLVCHRTMILLLETMFTPAKKNKGVDGAALSMPQNNDFIIRNNVYACQEDERCR